MIEQTIDGSSVFGEEQRIARSLTKLTAIVVHAGAQLKREQLSEWSVDEERAKPGDAAPPSQRIAVAYLGYDDLAILERRTARERGTDRQPTRRPLLSIDLSENGDGHARKHGQHQN